MKLRSLQGSALFRGMTEKEIESALKALRSRERLYKKGELILRAGSPVDELGIVISGSVTIESNDVWGSRTILSNVGAGQCFAESYALLPGEPLLVDVSANEDCRILFLSVSGLFGETACRSLWREKLTRNLLTVSARKNLTLSGRSFHISHKTIRARIMSYLNAFSLKSRRSEFDIPFDRQQLADYLNVERSALSKELGKMKADGVIDFRKNHFVLL